MKKIHKENHNLSEYFYKAIFVKPIVKYFRNRKEYPYFWTMAHDPICREILANGFYEKELLGAMVKLVKKNGTVLDIGANIGNHAIYFSKYFHHVIAFEPFERNCWILKANIKLNSIENIELVEKGLGKEKAFLEFSNLNQYETNKTLKPSTNRLKDRLIEVIPGDDALLKFKNIKDIVIIKIDVEGFERDVIIGLSKTISTYKPIIFWEDFEINKANDTRKILKGLGYAHFYHISKNKYKSKILNRFSRFFGNNVYIENMEMATKLDGMNVGSIEKLI
jgi:FkbM family methyltransferase